MFLFLFPSQEKFCRLGDRPFFRKSEQLLKILSMPTKIVIGENQTYFKEGLVDPAFHEITSLILLPLLPICKMNFNPITQTSKIIPMFHAF